jgi:hypothetical protein
MRLSLAELRGDVVGLLATEAAGTGCDILKGEVNRDTGERLYCQVHVSCLYGMAEQRSPLSRWRRLTIVAELRAYAAAPCAICARTPSESIGPCTELLKAVAVAQAKISRIAACAGFGGGVAGSMCAC